MTPDEKLAAQVALKIENERKLAEMKSGSDAETLKNWQRLGFSQPAPVTVQMIKNRTGLSWRKLRKFVEDM